MLVTSMAMMHFFAVLAWWSDEAFICSYWTAALSFLPQTVVAQV
jgi:hypothetical protein